MSATQSVSAFANVSYAPPDHTTYTATSTAGQRFSIFYPDGTPADYPDVYGTNVTSKTRWKYLLVQNVSGGSPGTSSAAPSSTLTSANGYPWQCLQRGFAVVQAQLTSFNSGNTGVTGFGATHQPGGIDGYYESRNRPNSLKDSVLLIQHLQFNTLIYDNDDPLSYNLDYWFGYFGSNSAFSLPWCGAHPSRACELGSGGPYEMNTVPNFIVANSIYPFNFYRFRHDEANTGGYFPLAETGGTGADDVVATNLAIAPRRYVMGMGAYQLLSDQGEPCHPFMFAFINTGPDDLNFSEPHGENVRKFLTGVHDAWHLIALRQVLPPGRLELRLSPAGANTLTDSQMTSSPISRAYYDGNLSVPASGHVGSTGRVTFTGAPSDGDLLTISDGTTTVIFEWDNNATVTTGHTAISLSGVSNATTAGDALVTAITNAGLLLTPTNAAGVVACPSTQTDLANNSTWTCTGTVTTTRGPASFGIVTIGTNPADADTLTLGDGVNQSVFEFDSGGGVTAGRVPVTIGGTTTVTMTNLKAAILASGLGLSWNNSATASNATTFTLNSVGDVNGTPTWATSVPAKITLNQPTGGGTPGGQSLTAEDPFLGFAINALVKAAHGNIPKWDATLPPAGIRRSGQVAMQRTAPTASITIATGNASDADNITIGDGLITQTFEFDNTGAVTAGRTGVTIGATAAATMTNLLAGIAASQLKLSWTRATVGTSEVATFTSTVPDGTPNVTWTKGAGANITLTGLTGGVQGRPRCIVPPAKAPNMAAPNGRTGVWLTCTSLSSDSDLLYGTSAYNCRKRLAPGESVWIAGTGKIWACSAGGGTNVAKYEARECDERSK